MSAPSRRTLSRRSGRVGPVVAMVSMIGLSACSGPSWSDTKVPEMSLAGMSFANAEDAGGQRDLTIQLRVKNPNDFDIPLESLRFDLDVDSSPFAGGLREEDIVLPAAREIVIPIRLSMAADELQQRVSAVGVGKRVDYRLTGAAVIDSWLADPVVSFDRAGKLALPVLPNA